MFKKYSLLAIIFLPLIILAQSDINLLKKINVNRSKNLDNTFISITNANNYVNYASITSVTIYGLVKKDKASVQKGLLLLSAQVSSAIATQGLKRIIKRERPFIHYSFIEPYKLSDGYSFPSGHTSSAFANAAALSIAYKKWYVVVPSYTFASLVGYSRMHLGVHYPSDVVAGAALGIGSAYLSNLFLKKLLTSKEKKKLIIK
jgi:membrane-associated phospholipid phosphatase